MVSACFAEVDHDRMVAAGDAGLVEEAMSPISSLEPRLPDHRTARVAFGSVVLPLLLVTGLASCGANGDDRSVATGSRRPTAPQ